MNLLSWIDSMLRGHFNHGRDVRIHEIKITQQENKTREQAEDLSRLRAELRSYDLPPKRPSK